MLETEQFKETVLKICKLNKELNPLAKKYYIQGGPNIFNCTNLKKLFIKLNITNEDDIAECINGVIHEMSQSQLNSLLGHSNLLTSHNKIGLIKVEEILVNEMEKRNQLGRLKGLFLSDTLNKTADFYIANKYVNEFFKSTNNVRDIVKLFLKINSINSSYDDKHFEKFYKILTTKKDNTITSIHGDLTCSMDKIKKFIKPEHQDKFNGIYLLLKLS